jgi:hypothetical protein
MPLKPEGWRNKRPDDPWAHAEAARGRKTREKSGVKTPRYPTKAYQSIEGGKGIPDWFEYPLPERIKDRGLSYDYYLSHAEALAKEFDPPVMGKEYIVSEGTVYEHFRVLVEMMREANVANPKEHKYWSELYDSMPKTVLDAGIYSTCRREEFNINFFAGTAHSIHREMQKSEPDPNYIEEKIRHLSEVHELVHKGSPHEKQWDKFRNKMLGRKG